MVKPSDLVKLSEAYQNVLKEDLGTGPNTISSPAQNSGVAGFSFPENQHPDNRSDSDFKGESIDMAISQIKNIVSNSKMIYEALKSKNGAEAWMITKIANADNMLKDVVSRLTT